MHTISKVLQQLDWISLSIRFFKSHLFPILGLGLLAAVGRATQLEAFGPVSPALNMVLEIGVESVRILIFFYALGLTNFSTGAASVVRLFSSGANRRKHWQAAVQQVRNHWLALVLNLAAFLLIAWSINCLIDYAAYQTCLYTKMKASGMIAEEASEWSLILFLKNISVIPFTLVFNALFLRWVTNRLTGSLTSDPDDH